MRTLGIVFGDERRTATVRLDLDRIPDTSDSGIYLKFHVPTSASSAKPAFSEEALVVTAPEGGAVRLAPVSVEVYHDLDEGVRAEVTVTSGDSPYAYQANLSVDGTARSSARGQTNTPIELF